MLERLGTTLEKTHVETENINGLNYITEGFLKRYSFKFEHKSSSIWGKIGKIAGVTALVVAAVAATIVTAGAGAVVAGAAGAVVSSVGISATSVVVGTSLTTAIISTSVLTGAAAIVAGATAGIIAST
jgi:hypothetical protein